MAPGLAARHPGIHTYSGRGVTDPSATIHADLTPLGFHASVRSAKAIWYVDPYFVNGTLASTRATTRARRRTPTEPSSSTS